MEQTTFEKIENTLSASFNPFNYSNVSGDMISSPSLQFVSKQFSGITLVVIVLIFAYIPVWMVATRTVIHKDSDCKTTGTFTKWAPSDIVYLKISYGYLFTCAFLFTVYRTVIFLNNAQSILSIKILYPFFFMMITMVFLFCTLTTCIDIWRLKKTQVGDQAEYVLSTPGLDRTMAWIYVILISIFLAYYLVYILKYTNITEQGTSFLSRVLKKGKEMSSKI